MARPLRVWQEDQRNVQPKLARARTWRTRGSPCRRRSLASRGRRWRDRVRVRPLRNRVIGKRASPCNLDPPTNADADRNNRVRFRSRSPSTPMVEGPTLCGEWLVNPNSKRAESGQVLSGTAQIGPKSSPLRVIGTNATKFGPNSACVASPLAETLRGAHRVPHTHTRRFRRYPSKVVQKPWMEIPRTHTRLRPIPGNLAMLLQGPPRPRNIRCLPSCLGADVKLITLPWKFRRKSHAQTYK